MVVGGFSLFFLQWFRAPDHQNHCKNRENNQKSVLKDRLRIVLVVANLAFLEFDSGFGVFSWLLVVFPCFFTVVSSS